MIQSFSVESRLEEDKSPGAPPATAAETAGHAPGTVRAARQRLIALTFDDRSIGDADIRPLKEAAKKFVRESLAPGDRVAVVSIAYPQTVTFSSDPDELVKKIEAIKPQPRMTGAGVSSCPALTPYQAYLIADNLDQELRAAKQQELNDCLGGKQVMDVGAAAKRLWELGRSNSEDTLRSLRSLVDGMSKLTGQRMVLLASSGFLTGDLEIQEEELISRALRAGVIVNTLQAAGLHSYTAGPSVEEAPRTMNPRTAVRSMNAEVRIQDREDQAVDDGLYVLALGTGGKFFHNSNDLAEGWRRIGAVPEVVYVLGFSAGEIPHDGRYRPLKVRLTDGHHYDIQARPGYSAPLKDALAAAPSELDREVLAADVRTELPVKIQAGPSEAPGGAKEVAMLVKVDVGLLAYRLRDDRKTQDLVMVAALLDSQGAFVAGKRADLNLALTPEKFAELARSNVEATLTVEAPPGSYTLRAVVCDNMGRFTALSRPIELR